MNIALAACTIALAVSSCQAATKTIERVDQDTPPTTTVVEPPLAPAPWTVPADTRPVCTDPIVTVAYGATTDCNVNPPSQLNVVYTEAAWGEGWGGDASLAWADQDCLDAGGRPVWDNGTTLDCQDVDY